MLAAFYRALHKYNNITVWYEAFLMLQWVVLWWESVLTRWLSPNELLQKTSCPLMPSTVLTVVTWAWDEVSPALISSIRVLSRGCSRRCWWLTPGDDTWTPAEEVGCCWPAAVMAVVPETQLLNSGRKKNRQETSLGCVNNYSIIIMIISFHQLTVFPAWVSRKTRTKQSVNFWFRTAWNKMTAMDIDHMINLERPAA